MHDPNASAVEKVLAAVQGAAEGFVEQSRAANFPAVAGAAVEKVTQSVQAVREELPARAKGAGPEGATGKPGEQVFLIEGARAPEAPVPLQDRAEEAVGRLEQYAESLRVASERAAEAPAAIRHEIQSTVREAAREARTAAVGYAATAVLGLFALAFVSIVVAVALNRLLGSPWGWLVVGLLYAIGAAVAFSAAKRSTDEVRETTRRGVANVKGEVREVTGSFRRVRAGGGPGAGA